MPQSVTPYRVNTATTADANAELLVAASAVGRKPLVLQGIAGQTGNLLEVQTSTGAQAATVGADGHVAIGAQNSTTAMLRVGQAGVNGMFNTSATSWGLWAETTNMGTGALIGVYARPDNTSGGTTPLITGGQFGAKISTATGIATVTRSVDLLSPNITAGGSVTSAIGLDINPQKVTGVTNGYAIYQRGTSDNNWFGGYVSIGSYDAIRPFTSQRTFVDADLAANRANAYFRTNLTPSITQSTYTNGASSALYINPPVDVTLSNIDGSLAALAVATHKQGDGNVGTMIGLSLGYSNLTGDGTVTNLQHLLVNNARRGVGAGTIGTVTGVYITTQSAAHVTTAYGIYQAGVNDLNYFGGSVSVGGQVLQSVGAFLVMKNSTNRGMLLQSSGLTTGETGGGLHLAGGGFQHDPARGAMWAGATSDLGTYTARAPTAAGINFTATGISFFHNTGLTVGSTYAPTLRMTLSATAVTMATGTILDLAKNELQNVVTHKLATAPAAPVEGLRYYDTTLKTERFYDGTTWQSPSAPSGAYLPLAGGTMTEGANIVLGTVTGTKIGTTVTQKIGWWNATPVVQNTGWTATAGYTALRSFNPQTTTLAEVARLLGTLVDTLKSYGLLG